MCRHGGRTVGNMYGPGTGRIWLDDVVCFGHETQFLRCRHRYWGTNNCHHSNDVSIVCENRTFGTLNLLLTDLRLELGLVCRVIKVYSHLTKQAY